MGGSRSWCTPGHSSFFSFVVVVVYTHLCGTVPTAGVPLAVHLFFKPSGMVAEVCVPLATHLLFLFLFLHLCGTVTKAGVPLAVHLFFHSEVGW